ncbi:MAG: hypothetical protein A3H28_05590 [Acidobacteria bacterium RIFCSPLOWO2_02_FULL_61_28]|nr:MAG: hypothetical protein A3H28_05590 [Acidobacteria bacterium RIFCSPLOWO2_02_FULL_61_28]
MRTTVDIPDPTYRELKSKAARQGCSVKELILGCVEKELRPRTRRRGRIELPIIKSKQPGILRLTNEAIYEVIPFP